MNSQATCPQCNRPFDKILNQKTRPFCSVRCQSIDLSQWLSAEYVISRPLFDPTLGITEPMDPVDNTSR
ncbi:MAG: DNA gyrase inhibitor YacG [Myxococcota bacterium]|nr:DNA gyrase inhibitor YacG [Myxococcota bacterium]